VRGVAGSGAGAVELRDGEQRVFFQAGGQWCYLWTPPGFRVGAPVPVVIHHHGYTGYVREGAADWLDDESKRTYLQAVMEGGRCAVAGSHACGDHWGHARAQAANAALFERLVGSPAIDPERVGLLGGGLGGLLLWNSVLGALAGRVKAALVMQANSSLECTIREQRFKALVLRGHGLPEDLGDDEAVERLRPSDPLARLRALAPGTRLPRTAIVHGALDDAVPPHSQVVPLAEALRRAGADVTLELVPGVGHAVYALGEPIRERLRAFFASAL
jgi:dipeptidyl aminopeptidase/acylaminoacyl peptidase